MRRVLFALGGALLCAAFPGALTVGWIVQIGYLPGYLLGAAILCGVFGGLMGLFLAE